MKCENKNEIKNSDFCFTQSDFIQHTIHIVHAQLGCYIVKGEEVFSFDGTFEKSRTKYLKNQKCSKEVKCNTVRQDVKRYKI